MNHPMFSRVLALGAIGSLAFFAFNFVGVVFFGGIDFGVGALSLRSTTIEFPLIGLLASFSVWLLISRGMKETLLFCCSVVLALGIVELGLRLVDHPLSLPLVNFNRWYEPSKLYGHQLVKAFEGLGPLHVPVKINSFGFRDVEHPKTNHNRTIRILGLGDSFTFGWGVPLEKTYLKQLEKNVQQATGRPAESINTGVPGWGLNQYYICLKEFGLQFNPDIVVVGYWPDDLSGPPVDKLEPVPNSQWQTDGQIKMRGGPLQHSRVFNFFTYLADQIKYQNRSKRLAHLHDDQARRAEWSKSPHFLVTDPGENITTQRSEFLKAHLSRINVLAAGNGASLIVLFIPDYSQLFHPEFQHINRVLDATARELGIPLLDMTPIYEATERSHPNYFWPLDGHTNVVGHQAIAEALTPVVCENLNKRHVPCRLHPDNNS